MHTPEDEGYAYHIQAENEQQQYEHEMALRTEMFSIPKDKSDLELKISQISNLILDGYMNPIECEISLKKFEELASGVRKKVRDNLLTELDKYTEKTITSFGADITKSSRSTLDYSTCNDSELQDLQIKADEINAKVKARQEMLKNIVPMSVVNPETGEYLNPPSKKTTEVITIKIK